VSRTSLPFLEIGRHPRAGKSCLHLRHYSRTIAPNGTTTLRIPSAADGRHKHCCLRRREALLRYCRSSALEPSCSHFPAPSLSIRSTECRALLGAEDLWIRKCLMLHESSTPQAMVGAIKAYLATIISVYVFQIKAATRSIRGERILRRRAMKRCTRWYFSIDIATLSVCARQMIPRWTKKVLQRRQRSAVFRASSLVVGYTESR
jgi:hypothetical protein